MAAQGFVRPSSELNELSQTVKKKYGCQSSVWQPYVSAVYLILPCFYNDEL